jgi:hypothetical protein
VRSGADTAHQSQRSGILRLLRALSQPYRRKSQVSNVRQPHRSPVLGQQPCRRGSQGHRFLVQPRATMRMAADGARPLLFQQPPEALERQTVVDFCPVGSAQAVEAFARARDPRSLRGRGALSLCCPAVAPIHDRCLETGAGERIRTSDLLITNPFQAVPQLAGPGCVSRLTACRVERISSKPIAFGLHWVYRSVTFVADIERTYGHGYQADRQACA